MKTPKHISTLCAAIGPGSIYFQKDWRYDHIYNFGKNCASPNNAYFSYPATQIILISMCIHVFQAWSIITPENMCIYKYSYNDIPSYTILQHLWPWRIKRLCWWIFQHRVAFRKRKRSISHPVFDRALPEWTGISKNEWRDILATCSPHHAVQDGQRLPVLLDFTNFDHPSIRPYFLVGSSIGGAPSDSRDIPSILFDFQSLQSSRSMFLVPLKINCYAAPGQWLRSQPRVWGWWSWDVKATWLLIPMGGKSLRGVAAGHCLRKKWMDWRSFMRNKSSSLCQWQCKFQEINHGSGWENLSWNVFRKILVFFKKSAFNGVVI